MRYILLIGAALNLYGGVNILRLVLVKKRLADSAQVAPDMEMNPADYELYRLFAGGVCFTFASLYIYLFFHIAYAMPFLIFGMALKYWAFLASLAAYRWFKLPKDMLAIFGYANLIVAILFSIYLLMA